MKSCVCFIFFSWSVAQSTQHASSQGGDEDGKGHVLNRSDLKDDGTGSQTKTMQTQAAQHMGPAPDLALEMGRRLGPVCPTGAPGSPPFPTTHSRSALSPPA